MIIGSAIITNNTAHRLHTLDPATYGRLHFAQVKYIALKIIFSPLFKLL